MKKYVLICYKTQNVMRENYFLLFQLHLAIKRYQHSNNSFQHSSTKPTILWMNFCHLSKYGYTAINVDFLFAVAVVNGTSMLKMIFDR